VDCDQDFSANSSSWFPAAPLTSRTGSTEQTVVSGNAFYICIHLSLKQYCTSVMSLAMVLYYCFLCFLDLIQSVFLKVSKKSVKGGSPLMLGKRMDARNLLEVVERAVPHIALVCIRKLHVCSQFRHHCNRLQTGLTEFHSRNVWFGNLHILKYNEYCPKTAGAVS
jgi:hypothetical protein